MKKRTWFRVVVDEKGKAVHCAAAGDEGTSELGVFYILAESAAEASKEASNRHCAKLLAARRARYHAEGLCKCGRKRDRLPLETCSGCAARHKVHGERKKARDRGEVTPPLDRRAVLQERKQTEAEQLRLEVLEEVRAAWMSNRTVGAFSAWLGREIEKAAGKKVA